MHRATTYDEDCVMTNMINKGGQATQQDWFNFDEGVWGQRHGVENFGTLHGEGKPFTLSRCWTEIKGCPKL